MKKNIIICLAAMAIAAGCTQDTFEQDPAGTTLTVGIDTRTYLGDLDSTTSHRSMLWAEGDCIVCNGVVSNPLSKDYDSLSSATFSFDQVLNAPYTVVYPADCFDASSNLSLPKYVKGGIVPLKGQSDESGNVSLTAVTSMVKVAVKQKDGEDADDIKYVEVNANGQAVRVKVEAATSTDQAIEAFVPALVGQSVVEVKVVDIHGHCMTKATSNAKDLKAGVVYSLPEIEFVPTTTVFDVEINSAADWNAYASAFNADSSSVEVFVKITDDLDFSGIDAVVLGDYLRGNYFPGTIDGCGHKISNLVSTHELIGGIDPTGVLKNLTIDETCSFNVADVPGAQKHFGPFVEYVKGLVDNCVNKAPISVAKCSAGNSKILYVGGIAGRIREGVVSNCTNEGNITLSKDYVANGQNLYAGGICGYISNVDGSISNCTNKGCFENAATALNVVMGGIVSYCSGTVEGCENQGTMNSTTARATKDPAKFIFEGGICGIAEDGADIIDCVNSAALSTSQEVKQIFAGGIVARVNGTMDSFSGNTSAGDITVNAGSSISARNMFLGGLIGAVLDTNTIALSGTPFTGKIAINAFENTTAGYAYAGGLVGIAVGELTLNGDNCSVDCNITSPLTATSFAIFAYGGVLGGAGDEGSNTANGNGVSISGFTTSGTIKVDGRALIPSYTETSFGGILGRSLGSVEIEKCSSSATIMFGTASTASKSNGKIVALGGIVGSVKPSSTSAVSSIDRCSFSGKAYNYLYNNNSVTATTFSGCNVGGIIGSYGYLSGNQVGCTISNCTVENAFLYGFRGATGGIAGTAIKATIDNCNVPSGSISRGAPAGGIAGYASGSSISGCTVKMSGIKGTSAGSCVGDAGGIVGIGTSCKVDGCKAFNTITLGAATGILGGIIGNPDANCTIGATTACSFGGSVAGTKITASNFGSFAIGNSNISSVNVSYWDGQ